MSSATETSNPAESAPPRAAERILRSARDLFYREGIRAVGVDEIVAQAGVTKPSLYRAFPSKDELAASYLRLYETEFWARFDAAMDRHPGEPRAQIMDYLEGLSQRVLATDYRGCGLTNAAVEYPERDHPARLVSERHKADLRVRLRTLAAGMGAADPDMLGDSLFLLIEGALVSSQIFPHDRPSASVAKAAALLIDAATAK